MTRIVFTLKEWLKSKCNSHSVYPEFLRKRLEKRILTNDSPFDSDLFKSVKREDRDKICQGSGAVILTTSGMMNGGPVMD